jgi:leucyl aminopeptidase
MVGRAAADAPRLIDMTWGKDTHPKLTLVGKGVCFDSGGLDIKPASGMLTMKKDMGGAAHALALAELVMRFKLPVRLRLLIPAVENAISANAFRPGDIVKTRKGLTVEIGNTDAEGRLVLCDALAAADDEQPDLLIDFATLTGAARVALGPDLPALFCNEDGLADSLATAARTVDDPMWRLPLWQPYAEMLKSPIADLNNSAESGFAGAITAALFLKPFVTTCKNWAHVDLYAWNASAKPGRPKGGEAMTLRAFWSVIRSRYTSVT